MQKYNATLRHTSDPAAAADSIAGLPHGSITAPIIGLAITLLAGCAGQPSTNDAGAAVTPSAAVAAAALPEPAPSIEAAIATAGPLSLRTDAPLHYTVKSGDTLWSIASYFLRDPWAWPQLWYFNAQVKNPHLIDPGDVLQLVMVDGRLRLMDITAVERLSPRIRDLPLPQAISTIPADAIRNFLHGPRLVTSDEIKQAPYVLEYTGEHIDGSANHGVYVNKLPAGSASAWAVVQVGGEYRDPDSGERLGLEAIPTGEVELRRAGQPAEMFITQSSREVMIGDRLLPLEASFDTAFFPHAPAVPVDGRIISVFDGVEQIGQYNIVALNRGSKAGLDAGTVLSIYQPGRVVPDPYGRKAVALPEQLAGTLMVFKVTPRLSYALVMSVTRPAHVLDKVHAPVPVQD